MARIPDDELDALKRSTDLAALVRSKGIVLASAWKQRLVWAVALH